MGGVIAVAAHAAAGLVLLAGLTKLWRPGVTHDALGLARGPRASLLVRGLGVASGNAAPGGVADLGTATARLGDGFQPGSGAALDHVQREVMVVVHELVAVRCGHRVAVRDDRGQVVAGVGAPERLPRLRWSRPAPWL